MTLLSIAEQEQIRNEIIAKCIPIGDCWIYTGTNNASGYGIRKIAGKHRTVSRFMLAYAERCMSGLDKTEDFPFDACHKDSICPYRACCNPAHLFWGTRSPNSTDREAREKQQREMFDYWEHHAWIDGKFYDDPRDPSIDACLASLNEGRKLPNGAVQLPECYGVKNTVQSYPESTDGVDPETWAKTLCFFNDLANQNAVAA